MVGESEPVLTRTDTREPPPARRLVLPALDGSVGLLRLSSADTGQPGWLRLGFLGEYASSDDFLVSGDRNRRVAGSLALGFSPIRFVELHGTFFASGNRNERCAPAMPGGPCLPDPGRLDPALIRVFGDVAFGAKLATPVGPGLRLGLQMGVRLLTGAQGFDLDGDATSGFLRALGSYDLSAVSNVPLLVESNLGFWLDNSSHLDDFERFGPDALESRLVASYAYGINRNRAAAALGLSAPLRGGPRALALAPFVEYHLEVVVADPDPLLAAADTSNRDQHWMSFGLKLETAGGLAFTGAVDIAVRPAGFAYTPWLSPYNLLFGIARAFDLGPPATRVVSRTYTVTRTIDRTPPPSKGRVAGTVVDAASGAPIAGAIVGAAVLPLGKVATDEDGRFSTKALAPGAVKLAVSAPGYEPQEVSTEVVVAETAAVSVSLAPRPALVPVLTHVVSGRRQQRPVADVAVVITGATEITVSGRTDAGGTFLAELPPGAYRAIATPPRGAPQTQEFVVAAPTGGAAHQSVLIALSGR